MPERFYGQCLGRKSDGEAEESDVGGAGVQCPGRELDGEAWMHEMPGTPSANAPGGNQMVKLGCSDCL